MAVYAKSLSFLWHIALKILQLEAFNKLTNCIQLFKVVLSIILSTYKRYYYFGTFLSNEMMKLPSLETLIGIVKSMANMVLHNTLCRSVIYMCKMCKMFETSKSFFMFKNFFGPKIFFVPKMTFCFYVLKKFFSGPKMTFC